ncbi:CoA transferase [Amycolatopsis rifamycinica]|uniref:Acyl-CoA transferase n=1 Tax=Amycolatopsis rifamycinica TaxID=287986 RepID=A0A066U5A4_9PSEU|nr:CoA transferase [Amycolatopsis rifamycinica]KDN22626.1 acyl-CoA transferase [Amycolatopsis rifamycinica]
MTATLSTAHPAARLAGDHLTALDAGDRGVEPIVGWAGPVDLPLTDEVLVQAACGIMHVHGRARGTPEPLAVDYATAVAGVLATAGVLAAEFARARGRPVSAVRTSVAQAALLSVGQYLACGPDGPARAAGVPPPFVSGDGVRFEIETLRAEDWHRFWRAMGAGDQMLREGWPPFLHRFATATCPLPAALHDVLSAHPFTEIHRAGAACEVSVVPIGDAPPVPVWTFSPLPGGPGAPAADPGLDAPLRGIRVVESARRIQGPLAGHVLGLLGADVLRIEPPGGDPARGVPPLTGGVSARFAALNAGKDAVELDLTHPAGRAAAKELVAGADVFLHNWAPGKAEAWGMDAPDLAAVRPGLVYAAASGWGPHLGRRPPLGTDYVVQAYSGLAAALRPPGEPPAPSLMTITDVLGGLVCAVGVLAGLGRRERTGAGCRADTSLLSAASTVPRSRREFRRPIRTADGYVAVSATTVHDDTGQCTSEELLAGLRAAGVPAVAVTTDLGALSIDPRFAAALHRPPWEFR